MVICELYGVISVSSFGLTFFNVMEKFKILQFFSCLIVGVLVLIHGKTVVDASVAHLIEEVPAQLNHGRVTDKLVQSVQRELIQIQVYTYDLSCLRRFILEKYTFYVLDILVLEVWQVRFYHLTRVNKRTEAETDFVNICSNGSALEGVTVKYMLIYYIGS